MLGLCLRVIDWVFHSPLLDKAATVTSAAAVLSLGAYAIFLILALPEEPPEPDIRLLTYLRAFFGDWLTGMSGPLSVPFCISGMESAKGTEDHLGLPCRSRRHVRLLPRLAQRTDPGL